MLVNESLKMVAWCRALKLEVNFCILQTCKQSFSLRVATTEEINKNTWNQADLRPGSWH